MSRAPVFLLPLALAAAVGFRAVAARTPDPTLPPMRAGLPSEYARIMSLSFDAVVADALWIRYVQAVPNRPAAPSYGRWLSSYLDTIVTLDPDFKSAYISGVTLLAVLGNQPCSALKTAERGTRHFPDDWRVHFQAGYVCFDSLANRECAARHMKNAAALPKKPVWLPGFVARLLSEKGQVDAAIEYLEAEIPATKDERLKKIFEERLREARLTRDLDRLQAAVRRFHLERDRIPASLDELVRERYLKALPGKDPFGGRYVLDERGRVASTSGKQRLRTHRAEAIYDERDPAERIYWMRVEARLPELVENPAFLSSPLGYARAMRGDPTASAEAIELLRRHAPGNAEEERQRHQLLARILIRSDLDALREAWLELQRETPDRRWTMAEIAERAGVPLRDPVGDEYVFGEDGLPSSPERQPMVSTLEDRTRGMNACP